MRKNQTPVTRFQQTFNKFNNASKKIQLEKQTSIVLSKKDVEKIMREIIRDIVKRSTQNPLSFKLFFDLKHNFPTNLMKNFQYILSFTKLLFSFPSFFVKNPNQFDISSFVWIEHEPVI